MRIIGEATSDHMIAAFLQAEISSPVFGPKYHRWLTALKLPRSIIDDPDRNDERENAARRTLLSCVRGYPDRYLFLGLPADLQWQQVSFERTDLSELLYCTDDAWMALTDGTRRVADGAAAVQGGSALEAAVHVRTVVDRITCGDTFPDLVCIATRPDGPFVLLEGHKRATAYVVAGPAAPEHIDSYVGCSPAAADWHWYGRQ